MKHPLHNLGKKNRNIISGILVGFASIFLIAVYMEIPFGVIGKFLLATIGLVLAIIIMAIVFIATIKGLGRLFSGPNDDGDQIAPYSDSDKE